jgi:hypothetical protein
VISEPARQTPPQPRNYSNSAPNGFLYHLLGIIVLDFSKNEALLLVCTSGPGTVQKVYQRGPYQPREVITEEIRQLLAYLMDASHRGGCRIRVLCGKLFWLMVNYVVFP